MIQYNVAQLLKEHIGSTRTYRLEGDISADDGSWERGKGHLSLMRTDKGVWVRAHLEMGVWGVCSRCLKRFLQPMSVTVEEEYLPPVDIITGQPLRATDRGEENFTIDRRHILSLDEAIRQYTIMQRPMKPLCKEDCLGLCPTCGVDRNVRRCECGEPAPDPQWGPLTKLLEASDT